MLSLSHLRTQIRLSRHICENRSIEPYNSSLSCTWHVYSDSYIGIKVKNTEVTEYVVVWKISFILPSVCGALHILLHFPFSSCIFYTQNYTSSITHSVPFPYIVYITFYTYPYANNNKIKTNNASSFRISFTCFIIEL